MAREDDAAAARALLASLGVEKYDPAVVAVVVEQMHRSVQALLSQARDLSLHSGRSQISLKDLQLSDDIAQEDNYASSPSPSREAMFQLASVVNSQPIRLDQQSGMRLPNKNNQLLDNPSFDILPRSS